MDPVCPLLGLAADGRTVMDGVDPAHRCHAETPSLALDRSQQAQVCLTSAFERCERFLQHAARTGGIRPSRAAFGDGLLSTRLVMTPEPGWRGIAGRDQRTRAGRLIGVAAGAVVAAAAGATVASALGGRIAPVAELEPTLSPSLRIAEPSPTRTLEPTTAPTLTPMPTAVPTPPPTPTAVPTPPPTPVPTPSPTRTYVVQEGDTLGLIASQFGVSVQAIQDANGIEDADQIVPGQVLVIP